MMVITSRSCIFLLACTAILCLSASAPCQNLNTGFAGTDLGFTGYMFDIEAQKNLTVDSLSTLINSTLFPSYGELWTTIDGGSFVGREEDSDAWKLIATFSIPVPLGSGAWTPLATNLDMFILAGTARGFHIAVTSGVGMRGFSSPTVGGAFVSNSDAKLIVGRFSTYFRLALPGTPSLSIDYTVDGPFTTDLRTHRIASPVFDPLLCQIGSVSEPLVVEFLNTGTTVIAPGTFVPATYQLNGQPLVTEFLVTATAVPPNGTTTLTFATPMDISGPGSHTVTVSHSLAGDQDPSDDSLTTVIEAGYGLRVTTFPWVEDFDSLNSINVISPPLSWAQETADSTGADTDWQFHNRQFVTASLPVSDHTTGVTDVGFFAHSFDRGQHPAVSLRSPCLDLMNVATPRLVFWIFSRSLNVQENVINVDVLDLQTGTLTLSVHGPIGALPVGWHRQVVDLSAFSGTLIRIIFRATTNHQGLSINNSDHDIAIDDVAVFDFVPTTGQAAQPGFASFDIAGALNGNLETVDSGLGGPFFTTVQPNVPMFFEFSGEPQMPVILIGGVLNPGAASYPVIGSIDVGGVVDPSTGIPTGIVVLADGNLSTGLHPLFNTGPTGDGFFGVTLPNIPPGLLATFQCAISTTGANGSYIALSNAIEVTVQ